MREFRQDELQVFRRRWATARDLLAWLWPDPTNEHHENAIRVMALEPFSRETCQGGFLPRELADHWIRPTRRFIERTGFYPTFPASFIGGFRKYQNLGMLVAASEPAFWEERMEAPQKKLVEVSRDRLEIALIGEEDRPGSPRGGTRALRRMFDGHNNCQPAGSTLPSDGMRSPARHGEGACDGRGPRGLDCPLREAS
ncbi:MAG: hypothetical protein L6R30_13870 [Thermoanaerobaculia bacterium]|nr:hypothetical protein [Thermoanaerobaculia bacterium]